jgi:hypothetical protein
MKKLLVVFALTLLFPLWAAAGPRLFVTGVTEYDPAGAWNGFTILSGNNTAKLVDMNGNLVHEWDLRGGAAMPGKVFPNGVLGANLYPAYHEAGQGNNTQALLDFNGGILRSFNRLYKASRPGDNLPRDDKGEVWIARNHHDFQIEGSSVGYYYPDAKPNLDGKMMILCHISVNKPEITDKMQLQDDRIIIVDKAGSILFDWKASDHFAEFKNMATDKNVMERLRNAQAELGNPPPGLEYNGFDWFHINCVSWLGPNKWYDAGDQRFHPDNIIADSRETSHLFIIDHVTGKIVWQVAPPFEGEDAELGAIYGVHGTHMIPQGLPGAGNILIFDNGGTTSYHKQLPPRYYSRVLEFDPVTKKIVWEYSFPTAASPIGWQLYGDRFFFSSFISIAQRLPNGNTLITEGNKCRIFEVTKDLKIVWEYISPYNIDSPMPLVYRAYRLPYGYVPQLPKGSEVAVRLPKSGAIQIPNADGVLPDVTPKKDSRLAAAVFTPLTPVLMPGLKGVSAAQVPAPAEEEDEEDGPTGFKAY